MNLSEPFIHRPVATSLVMAAVALAGIAAFPFPPVASLPQIDFPTIQVTATMAGARAETMAVSVATPLERADQKSGPTWVGDSGIGRRQWKNTRCRHEPCIGR